MNEPRVSAVIIARDEAHDLDGCLDSLAWADEIVVVVDARSRDATESIARRRATHTLVRAFDHFAAQRNAGIDRARSHWILSIDADERVSDGLAQEIQTLTRGSSHAEGARIPISSEILGRTLRYCGTQLDRPIRLFRRDSTRWQGEVHERVTPAGLVVTLRHPILHRSLSDLDEFLTKIHAYTSLEAEKLARQGIRPRRFDLTLRPLNTFLKLYVVRRGFLDGVEGFLYCTLSAVSLFVRNAKLRERTNSPPFEGGVRGGRATPRESSNPTPRCPPFERGEKDLGSVGRSRSKAETLLEKEEKGRVDDTAAPKRKSHPSARSLTP